MPTIRRMTYDEELDFWIRRHNDPARMRMWSAALMMVAAWIAGPLIVFLPVALTVNFICMLGTGSFGGGLAVIGSPPFLTSFALAYLAPNAVIFLRTLINGSEHSYEGAAFSFFTRLYLWPAHMTAEVINQCRRQLRFSKAQRVAAKFLMFQLHLAGPDGLRRAPADADETELVEKLKEIGAIRTQEDSLVMRMWRRETDFGLAIPTTLGRADQPPIGLIAGGGNLPLLQALGMRAAGRRIAGIGFKGQYDPALIGLCDSFTEASPLRPGAWVRILARRGAFEAVMVGHVTKTKMHNPLEIIRRCPDFTALHLWFVSRRHDRRSQGLLAALAQRLETKGLLLMSTTDYIPEHLASLGTMTRRAVGDDIRRDIKFALPILRQLNELDIGQGLCVKGGDVIALEAMEGTDRMIARAGELCPRGGWTLVKGSDPDKDPRFDVPTIGVTTIENLKKAGASALAVVAERTIFINKPEVLAAAEKAGIAVIGVELD